MQRNENNAVYGTYMNGKRYSCKERSDALVIPEKKLIQKQAASVMKDVIQIFALPVLMLFVFNFFVMNITVPSESMESTLHVGDRLIGNRFVYTVSEPERYDIAVFRYPDDPTMLFVKRIIGLPGETLTIREGKVYINDSNEPLDDSFVDVKINDTPMTVTIPEGCYFMMGDNRNDSLDSRYWENMFVERSELLCRVEYRYYPAESAGSVRYTEPR